MSRLLVAQRALTVPGWAKNVLWRSARAVPSLDLRFADNKSLVDAVTGASLVTFTRASSGTVTNSAGALQTAAIDVPRFDHNPTTGESLGLLVEEQRTNLLLNSGTLSTQSATVTAAAHTLHFTGTGTITLTGTSTAGPLVGTGTGEANRVSLTFTPTAGSLTLTVSGTVTNAQLEAGAFQTSYIATAGAQATRSADVASITGTAFSGWYRQDEGTVYVDGSAQRVIDAAGAFLEINDSTANNQIDIRHYRTDPFITGSGLGPVTWSIETMPVITSNIFYRQSVGYSSNSQAFAINGSIRTSTGAIGAIAANRIGLFMRDAQTAPSGGTGGHIRRIVFWPIRLPDSTHQSLTQ